MVKELKGSLVYLFSNLRFSLIVFWSILIAVLLISVVTSIILEDSHVSFNMSAPVYFFTGVFGFWMVKNGIPFLIKMGATRKAIFIASGIFGIVLSLLNAIIANTIIKIVSFIYKSEGINSALSIYINGNEQQINHISQFIGQDSIFSRIAIDSTISFFLFCGLFLSGLIFYKYGVVGGISFSVLVFLFIIYAGNVGWLETLFIYLFSDFNVTFFYQLFAVGIVFYLLSFLLLRRLTIR